jgi:hypothetical protein
MIKPSKARKQCTFVITIFFLSAGFIPTINGVEPHIIPNDTITADIAKKVAATKLQELQKQDVSIGVSTEVTNENGQALIYIFDLVPQGYLVVSAAYDLPPVIAYSFTSNFGEKTTTNLLYELVCADVTLRLGNIQKLPTDILTKRHQQWESFYAGYPFVSQRFEQWPPEGSTPTGGWLLTNWHQSAPYNNFCPLDISHGGARSVAGCPAVAMAQILNYHNTTNNIVFDDTDDYHHVYGGNNYWIDNDFVQYGFPSFPQLDDYLNTLQYHYQNQIPLTSNDKAAITFACGVAATQVYGASVSGTFGVSQAYDAYLRFNCTTVSLLDENDPDLYTRLSSNMKDAVPAHLAVVDPGWTMGHNLVIDGYNTDEYYHLNFGWGGSYNGWYLIPDEIPYGLTVIEGVIVDIMIQETGIPDLTCSGSLNWTNVTPCETATGSFTVSNIGESGSYLDWEISEWPSWGSWSFTPSYGNNLKPEDGPVTITVDVEAPNQEHELFTGEIRVVNSQNSSDFALIPVSLETGYKIHEKLHCSGSLTWVDIKPLATVTGNFTVENVGAALTNLSWEVKDWPEWGTWTFTPSSGENLKPEDGPVTIMVRVVAPMKKDTRFTGEITLVNSHNSSDYDTVSVSLATPYNYHVSLWDLIQVFLERFPCTFPLLRLLFIQ